MRYRWILAAWAFSLLGAQGARTDEPIEEVVITSTKRAQSLQDASVSVSAIPAEKLVEGRIDGLEDLQRVLPGLSVGNDFSFAKIFVRGIGLNSSFPGLDPSVALHVDGIVSAQAAGQFTSLYDVERVEVLRGPQGTLYGRNATGGSINLVTAKPTPELSGYARLSIGGRELDRVADAALSGPLLGESVLGRIALHVQDRDGFGEHTGSGEDIDDARVVAGRSHLQFLLSDDLELMLSAELYDENDHSRALKFFEPSFPNTRMAGLVALGLPSVLPDSRNVGGDFRPTNERETWAFTGALTWSPAPRWTVRSLTGFRKLDDLLIQDFDVSDRVSGTFPPSATSSTQLQGIDEDQLSEELQLLFEGERLSALAGLYTISETVRSEIRIGRDPEGFPDRSRVNILAALDVNAYAAFTNMTYRLTDQVALKLGARYSSERRAVKNRFGVASPVQAAAVFDPRSDDADRFKDVSPEIGVEYRPGDGLLLYATYSEGFKSGTANLGERMPRIADPEEIENFELGMKGEILDSRLRANLALFQYEVTDAQFDRTFPIAAPPFFAATLDNAATTDGRGVELEALALLAPGLTLALSGTLYDIEFDDFLSRDPLDERLFGPGGASVPPEDLSGNKTRNTPDWTISAGASYALDLANGASVVASGTVVASDEQFFSEFNDRRLKAGKTTQVDASLKYTTPSGRISVILWGKNLTDEFVESGAFAISTSRTIGGTYLPPRTYGVTLEYALR